jgi:dolichol-phosphate mannosyltransferase
MYNSKNLSAVNIAVVIPAYRVEKEIEDVIRSIPDYISHIVVVNDASPDRTGSIVSMLAENHSRISLVNHEHNQGVGGVMVTGFCKALQLGAQIVVKVDGDGQMDLNYLLALITPLVQGKADYTKGNRFRDFVSLRKMPSIRRLGNIMLGFLSKLATGYWNIFDPTNGYVAIRAEVLAQLPLERIARTYYFETSMLAELYLVGAYVLDVPIPARYGSETSSLKIHQILFEFPPRLLLTFLRRMLFKNFLYDFSMISIYLLSGIPLFLFSLIFGINKWIKYASLGIPAPTGTVMLPTLCAILSIQLLLSAIQIDLQSVPRSPLSNPIQSNS